MNKTFFTALALLCACSTASADTYKGSSPTPGESYYLYNVDRNEFLGTDGNSLVLGGEKVEVTLESIESSATPGFFRIKTASGELGATLFGTPSTSGGTYSEWRIERVEGTESYAIASRNAEASASFYLYQSPVYNRLAAMPRVPSSDFKAAQWLLVSTKGATPVYTFSEDDTQYDIHADGEAEVQLARSFNLDAWNGFCSPINISEEQIKEQFGDGTKVAEFTGFSGNEAQFTSVSSIKAGVPYLILPKKDNHADHHYTFTGDMSFATSTSGVDYDGVSFCGTLASGKYSSPAYVVDGNHGVEPATSYDVCGMNAYFSSQNHVVTSWSLDGETAIGSVNADGSAPFDVFTTAGQKVKSKTHDTNDLQKGVYIMGGKKRTK